MRLHFWQAHLGTLARYKYMLSMNINELPSYRNPPDDNETPSKRSRRLYRLEQIPQMISRVCPKNLLLCIVLIFVPTVATNKYSQSHSGGFICLTTSRLEQEQNEILKLEKRINAHRSPNKRLSFGEQLFNQEDDNPQPIYLR
jgi:hypothetical protein